MIEDPKVVASMIQGSSTILATLIAAITANIIGKKFSKQEKLKDEFKIALSDIEFLLEVEKEHCRKHKENSGDSYKNRVREIVKNTTGLSWSGYNTKSKLKRMENN